MVKKIEHKELGNLIKTYYKHKVSLMIYGRFGIGKSQLVREVAKEIADRKNKDFVEWNKISKNQKQELFNNPEKHFVFIDIRLSEFDGSDIKGLPVFNDNKESIDFKSPLWALYMAQKKSDGILFADELNLAVPIVISSFYKILHDKIINEMKASEDWLIIGAGNTEEDRAYVHELASPVKDRMGEVELVTPSVDCWTEWAIKNNIDGRIIGYLNFKQSNLWNVDFDSKMKYSTPRGWERVSKLIENIKNYDELELVSSSAIGEGVASEFVAFCKIQEEIKLDDLIKNPDKIKKLPENEKNLGIKYFIVSAVADKYRTEKVDFEKVVKISKVLDEMNNPEFVALMWRLCLGYKEKEFKESFMSEKLDKKFADKYSKWII